MPSVDRVEDETAENAASNVSNAEILPNEHHARDLDPLQRRDLKKKNLKQKQSWFLFEASVGFVFQGFWFLVEAVLVLFEAFGWFCLRPTIVLF